MLRRQWVDHERLTYPIVEVGTLLTETQKGGRLSQVFSSPLFWIAFGLVMLLKVWNIGSYFTPIFPHIPFEGGQFRFYPDFPFLIRRVSFYAVGFGYFARLERAVQRLGMGVFYRALRSFYSTNLGTRRAQQTGSGKVQHWVGKAGGHSFFWRFGACGWAAHTS